MTEQEAMSNAAIAEYVQIIGNLSRRCSELSAICASLQCKVQALEAKPGDLATPLEVVK